MQTVRPGRKRCYHPEVVHKPGTARNFAGTELGKELHQRLRNSLGHRVLAAVEKLDTTVAEVLDYIDLDHIVPVHIPVRTDFPVAQQSQTAQIDGRQEVPVNSGYIHRTVVDQRSGMVAVREAVFVRRNLLEFHVRLVGLGSEGFVILERHPEEGVDFLAVEYIPGCFRSYRDAIRRFDFRRDRLHRHNFRHFDFRILGCFAACRTPDFLDFLVPVASVCWPFRRGDL